MDTSNYLIVGDNNFWYDTLHNVTEQQLHKRIDELKDEIARGIFDEQINMLPNDLIAYEISEPLTFTVGEPAIY